MGEAYADARKAGEQKTLSRTWSAATKQRIKAPVCGAALARAREPRSAKCGQKRVGTGLVALARRAR